jgi:hypothetical protein
MARVKAELDVILHEWGGNETARVHRFARLAAAIPFVAHAQQSERMRSIGVLLPASPNDPVFQARLAAFHQELALLGWIIGRNVRIDTRWATTDPAEISQKRDGIGRACARRHPVYRRLDRAAVDLRSCRSCSRPSLN